MIHSVMHNLHVMVDVMGEKGLVRAVTLLLRQSKNGVLGKTQKCTPFEKCGITLT